MGVGLRESLVLGMDPGTRKFGWGVIAKSGMRITHRGHGVIRLDEKAPLANRLVALEAELVQIVALYQPTESAVESMFFGLDASAAGKLAHARAIAMLVCARAGLQIGEYPPSRVKSAVAGGGRADKTQLGRMVMALLKLTEAPALDASDALAIALTHAQRSPLAALERPKPRGPRTLASGASLVRPRRLT